MNPVVHGWVSGHVQGVGFRWHVRKWAHHLAVQGWVRNLEDDRVEFMAQAETAVLEQFLQKVRQGPQGSRVTSLREEWPSEVQTLGPFEIR